jgi:hypothetical protein
LTQRFLHRSSRRSWPKNVCHRRAILPPCGTAARDWHVVELSTLLMLRIIDVVRQRERAVTFSPLGAWRRFEERLVDG